MATSIVTIYKPADLELVVINADPPTDQAALIASLQADLASTTAQRDAVQAKFDSLNSGIDALQGQV